MTTQDYKNIIQKFPPERINLLRILHEIQNQHPQNYLPREALYEVADYLNLTMAAVYGAATYYTMFSLRPRGKYIIRLCQSPICGMMGSQTIVDHLKSQLKIKMGETTADGLFSLEYSECLGRCGKAPSMMINENTYTGLTPDKIKNILVEYRSK